MKNDSALFLAFIPVPGAATSGLVLRPWPMALKMIVQTTSVEIVSRFQSRLEVSGERAEGQRGACPDKHLQQGGEKLSPECGEPCCNSVRINAGRLLGTGADVSNFEAQVLVNGEP